MTPGPGWRRPRIADSRQAGFTLPEMLIGMVLFAILAALGMTSYREYRESTAMARATRLVSADMTLARTLAIRVREPVSLVSRDSARTYVIRDTAGTVFHRRSFDGSAELRLDRLDVATTGDSLTFNGRGMLITNTPLIVATRGDRVRSVAFNALGKSRIF